MDLMYLYRCPNEQKEKEVKLIFETVLEQYEILTRRPSNRVKEVLQSVWTFLAVIQKEVAFTYKRVSSTKRWSEPYEAAQRIGGFLTFCVYS